MASKVLSILIVRETEITATVKHHLPPIRTAAVKEKPGGRETTPGAPLVGMSTGQPPRKAVWRVLEA